MKLNSNNLFRSLKIVWRSSPKWALVNAIVVILRGILPLLLIYLVKVLIDTVTQAIKSHSIGNDLMHIKYVLIFAAVVFVVSGIINSLGGLFSEKYSYFINDSVQNIIHNRIKSLNYSDYEHHNFQNIFYRAISESSYRPTKIFYGFIGLIQNGITLLLIGGLLAGLSWYLLLFLVFMSLPIVFVRLRYSKKIYNLKRENTEDERKMNYYNNVLTGRDFAKEVRVFGLNDLFKSYYESSKVQLRKKNFKLLGIKSIYELFIQIITAISLIIVFAYIAKNGLTGEITQGQMVMYFLALHRGYGFLQQLLINISSLYNDGLFLTNFFEFIDYKTIENETSKFLRFPSSIQNGIEFKNIEFKYPSSNRTVFQNLNLSIKAGEKIALVGSNGSGKSTLIKMLCGLYQPTKGQIFIDDCNIENIKNTEMSKNITVVFQDFMLYNVSANDNIWYGDITKSNKDDFIVESAKKSGIHKVFSGLKHGYDTQLGNLFENSEMLSLGEWQRIALARSFFNDAQLVILDEPTSSLDAFTEAELINNFSKITKEKTAIIVSHRLSTIKIADRIVVVGDKKILETGTYKQLVDAKGVFYNMINKVSE